MVYTIYVQVRYFHEYNCKIEMMIAKFPDFSKLDLSHKQEVEEITSSLEPYSDFNFISLFCWDTDGTTKISDLNGNLVIHLPHYLTGEAIYSLAGKKMIDESLRTLLKKVNQIELVPEVVIANVVNRSDFIIEDDPDNHDYVFSLADHADLPGQKFKGKRKKVSHFVRNHQNRYEIHKVDLADSEVLEKINAIFDNWANAKGKNKSNTQAEKQAVRNLLMHAANFDTVGLMISVDDRPAGFSIHELQGENYAICHFHKTIPDYANIDVFLTSTAAKDLMDRKRTHVNWEQDLGIKGLKAAKSSYHPVRILKKYRVRLA